MNLSLPVNQTRQCPLVISKVTKWKWKMCLLRHCFDFERVRHATWLLGKKIFLGKQFAYPAGFFYERLGSNSFPVLGLTRGQKFSNSANFDVTQKSGVLKQRNIEFKVSKVRNLHPC